MSELLDLVIVGAGAAGLAAAVEAARLGLESVLVDSYPQAGGQYFKQLPAEFDTLERAGKEGDQLLSALAQTQVRWLPGTDVWGIFPGEDGPGYLLGLYGPSGTPRRLRTKLVILAPGAYDRPLPFPGWTLPGVMTAGAAQVLIKHQRVLPGRKVLLSGTGPLQLALASQLIAGGAEVVAILEANPFPWSGWRRLGAVWGQWERLAEGGRYWREIRRAGVPLLWGQTVKRAIGKGRVERVSIGRVGKAGGREMAADTICLGYGFVPSAQLSLQAGAEHQHRSDLAATLPVRDQRLQTTLPGLFVAGDGAGIGGKDVALLEGKLAALGAAIQLGRPMDSADMERIGRALARQRRFADLLEELFPFRPELWELMTDDTVVCRCEEITAGEVRQAVEQGATTPKEVKNVTRVGMGRCQGRMCGGPLAYLVARETGRPVDEIGYLAPRPPVIPVPLEGLLEDEN